jgi:hypothetical protein
MATVSTSIAWESDASKVTASLREAAAGADKLGDSSARAKQKAGSIFDGVGNRAMQFIAGVFAAQKAIELMGAAFRSIPDEIGRVVSKAAGLADLGAKLDMDSESLQRFQYMGSLVGVSMESLANAALKLQENLAKNPDAFKKWGLDARELRDLKPEQQLVAISDAIRSIGDRQQQVAAIKDLMGKGGAENLGLMRQDLSALIVESDQLGVAMGDKLVGKLDDVDDATTRLSTSWEALKDKIVGGIVAASGADDFLNDLAKALGAVNGQAEDNKGLAVYVGLLERLTGLNQLRDMVAILSLINEGGPGAKGATKKGIGSVFAEPDQIDFNKMLAEAVKLTEDMVKADAKAAEAAKKHAEQEEKLAKAMAAGRQAEALKAYTVAVDENMDAVMRREGIGRFFEEHLKNEAEATQHAAETAKDYADALDMAAAQVAAAVIADVTEQTEKETKATQEHIVALEKQAREYDEWAALADKVAQTIGGTFGTALSGVASIFDALSADSRQAAQDLRDNASASEIAARQGAAYVGVVLSVVAAYKAGVQSGDKFESTLNGVAAGFAAGIQTGNIYVAVIAGIVGGIMGFIGASEAQRAKMRELRAEFEKVEQQGRATGATLGLAFNPKTAWEYAQAITEINRLMALQEEAARKVDDVMQRYGITIDQLGPKWKQQKMHESAMELYEDFRIILAITENVDLAYELMGDKLITFFQNAIKFGTEMPEFMRPLLQYLIDHGLLLDANGDAYKDLESTGITFTTTMTAKFQTLLDKITELVDAINRMVFPDKSFNIYGVYVPPKVPGTSPRGTTPGWTGPWNYDGSEDHDDNPYTPMAMGMHRMVYGPTRLLVGEDGPERVDITPAGQGHSGAAGDPGRGYGGPQTIVIQNAIGGEKLDSVIMRRVRGGYIRVA